LSYDDTVVRHDILKGGRMELPEILAVTDVELHALGLDAESTGCDVAGIVEVEHGCKHLAMRAEIKLDAAASHDWRQRPSTNEAKSVYHQISMVDGGEERPADAAVAVIQGCP
jgi:hypothetical protein